MKTKIVELSNGNFVPMVRRWIGPFPIWKGVERDLDEWDSPKNISRYCQCSTRETAEEILLRKAPPVTEVEKEIRKAM